MAFLARQVMALVATLLTRTMCGVMFPENPKTFGETWEMARGSAQSKADTDFLVRSTFVEDRPDFAWQGYQPVFVRPSYDAKTAEPVLSVAFAPGYVHKNEALDLSQHQMKGKDGHPQPQQIKANLLSSLGETQTDTEPNVRAPPA